MKHFKFLSLCILVTGVGLFSSCKWPFERKRAEKALYLINVLDSSLFNDCRIKPAQNVYSLNVSMESVVDYARKNLDKEQSHIVLYCANYKCTASGASAKLLKNAGFKQVWAYEAGIAEWKHLGYPVDGRCQAEYLADFEPSKGLEHDPAIEVISTNDLKTKYDAFKQGL